MAQLRGHDNMTSQSQTDADVDEDWLAAMGQDVSGLLQRWFREQRRFEENVELRQQHNVLTWQLQQLRQHLAEKQVKLSSQEKSKQLA